MAISSSAAIIFALVALGVVAFQFALALGAPWGAYAMGGSFPGTFPPAMRVAAVVQALVIGLIAVVVLARAWLVLSEWQPASTWAIWIAVAFSGISVVLNAISPSGGERKLWVPVTIVLLASSLVVALVTA